jgi:integrase/recombinase XerD
VKGGGAHAKDMDRFTRSPSSSQLLVRVARKHAQIGRGPRRPQAASSSTSLHPNWPIRPPCLARTRHVEVRVAELTFPDPKGIANRLETTAPTRLTRAHSDVALVESWLSTFDPVASARTLVLYGRVSRAFLNWLSTRGLGLGSLTTDDLAAWRDQLSGAPATRANRLAVAKSLLTYANETGFVRFNVGKAVKGPKVDADVDARSLSELQVGLMIQAATTRLQTERARCEPRPRYLRAALTQLHLIRVLYYSACRVSEAVSIKWADLQERPDGDYQVSVVGKGGKRRRFPLPRRLVEDLLSEYRPLTASSDVVFALGSRRAQTIVRELAQLAGLDLPVSPHWLRHAAATHALDRGAPVHVVQQTLGHASLVTTGQYAHKRADGAAKYLPRL